MHTQMRTSSLLLLASFLLLLTTRAHGIRLDRQLQEAINKKQEIIGDSKEEQSHETARLMNKQHCTSDGHCNSGKAKRPLVQAEAGAAAKQMQQQKHQSLERPDDVNQISSSSTTTAAAATYPDILDIAGMDYSPATRKPPIHN